MSFDDDSHTAWISQGFERLVKRVRRAPKALHFDVLIVGSGYGGAVTAATMAGRIKGGRPVRVGVLERGKEYLPGAFPTGLGELPQHLRRDGNKEGLIDVRVGPEVLTVVANGVGGGSLINAGVMAIPEQSVFQAGWPDELKDLATWKQFYERAGELLGATENGVANTIAKHPDGLPQKSKSIRNIAPAKFREAAITVAMSDTTSSGNVKLFKCLRCGDCATGCNFGAKNSLDVNLLVRAHQNGAEIFSGATVLGIEKTNGAWIVNCVHTNAALRARDSAILKIRAAKVVLAAGTLGSYEILKRSHDGGLELSDTHLGNRCSTNGDMLITDYATSDSVNAVSDETVRPSERAIGPTITGMIDLRDTAGVLIEELAVPASLRLAFTEVFATINTLHGLDQKDWTKHRQGFPTDDAYVAPSRRVEHSAIYAVMANDGAAGHLELDGRSTPDRDGIATMRWDELPDHPVFDAQVEAVAGLIRNSGGRIIPNPAWKLLPEEMAWLLGNKRGPLTTVHPLGGCVMGKTGRDGVVDHMGRVFSGDDTAAVHDGLVVLDGSIVPSALGINPALTIAAIALRAAEGLAGNWGYVAPAAAPAASVALVRPKFRKTDFAAKPPGTKVEIIERLVGPVSLRLHGGNPETKIVEITLRFKPKLLAELTPSNGGKPVIEVRDDASEPLARSMIRIYPQQKWQDLEQRWAPPSLKERQLDEIVEYSAPLTGTLAVMERQETCLLGRLWRAGKGWVLNRGLRDSYQAIFEEGGGPGLWKRIKSGLAIASRSGEIRAFVYDLKIGTPDPGSRITLGGDRIRGFKRFTYARRCNPWRQLMEVTLEKFPGMNGTAAEPILKLDVDYLARIGVPLFRVTEQRDGVAALGELAMFLGYFLRLLLGLHIWSFRSPDKDTDSAKGVVNFKPPAFLKIPGGGTVAAVRQTLVIGREKPDLGGPAVVAKVLLTRYPYPGTTKRPLVMFHGYSAGGTTFAHHAVNPNFASYFWKTGRDIWVADLRTSPAHGTATPAWSFDQVGKEDVAKVLTVVSEQTNDSKVDVVAHCMGAVCFSIAALSGEVNGLVDRAAFTQVGPLLVFTPANIFRAYVLRYLLEFLPDTYSFNPENPTLADDLWDRVLSTLPYPAKEFDVENPVWPWKRTPWTRTRHRMDALYGRAFNVSNMEPGVLRFINEQFGALSLKTVSTTLHFVRYALMTDFRGKNEFVSRQTFGDHWSFPTFSVHGADNGMIHSSTTDRMRGILKDAGRVYPKPFLNPGAGHQDAVIGTARQATFHEIERFLDSDPPKSGEPDVEMTAYPPWIGPIITEEERVYGKALVIRLGALPSIRTTQGVVMLRVQVTGRDIARPDGLPWDLKYILDHMMLYQSSDLEKEGWAGFDAPLPASMPGPASDPPGNALLVLLAYAEDKLLPPSAVDVELYALSRDRKVYQADPLGSNADPRIEQKDIKIDQFQLIAAAAQRALEAYQPNAPTDATGAGDAAANTRDAAVAEAALERVVEQDRDLMEGVIFYDLPSLPREQAPAEGTSFILASCQYPAGFVDGAVAYRSYSRIADRIGAGRGIRPQFAVFVGDQVYVDPTAGLYDPATSADRYRLPYEAWLREQNVRSVLRRIPSFMLLDDHEIEDNWEPLAAPDLCGNAAKKDDGLGAYRKYQRGRCYEQETFNFNGFRFFLLDTRTERRHRAVDASLRNASLFDAGTMGKLKKWLKEAPKGDPKFIASPSMFLPRHRRAIQRDASLDASNLSALHSDSWDGYPNSLRDVLAFIAAEEIKHVVFLSGDEHRGCIATAELRRPADNRLITTVHSIHTAAMYAPYPFANGIDEDIVKHETFDVVTRSGGYRCVVSAKRPAPGDGATFLSVRKDGNDWKLDCEFAGTIETLVL